MLNNTFVIKVIGFVVFLKTSLKPISIEVILMGGVSVLLDIDSRHWPWLDSSAG